MEPLQTPGDLVASNGGSPVMLLLWILVAAVIIASLWKIFVKAGQPGWASIVPIYNLIVLLKIAGKPLWWFFLFLIPLVNFVIGILVTIAFAKNFGKSGAFAAGLIFLPFIFYPVLAFSDAEYRAQ